MSIVVILRDDKVLRNGDLNQAGSYLYRPIQDPPTFWRACQVGPNDLDAIKNDPMGTRFYEYVGPLEIIES